MYVPGGGGGGGGGEGKGVHTKIQGREWKGILVYSILPVLLLDEVTEWLSCMISGYRLQASSSRAVAPAFSLSGSPLGASRKSQAASLWGR